MSDDNTEVTVSKDGLKIAGRDTKTIAIVATLIVSCVVAWMLYEHKAIAAQQQQVLQTTLEKAFDKLTDAQLQSVTAQRESNCLLAYRNTTNATAADRTELVEFCKRLAR